MKPTNQLSLLDGLHSAIMGESGHSKLKIFGAPISKEAEESIHRSRPKVKDIMSDGNWHTLEEMSNLCRISQASVSARIRELKHYGMEYDRQLLTKGTYKYRVI